MYEFKHKLGKSQDKEMRMRKKVTVVGGGFVGSTTAQRIHDAGLADVVLTDILDGVPAGKALDMAESGPILGSDAHVDGHFHGVAAIIREPRTATLS